MRAALLVVVLVAAIVLVVGIALAAMVGLARRRGQRRVHEQVGGLTVTMRSEANCFGVASKGPLQVRGSGTLLLLADELRFVSWGGAPDLIIPTRAITAVDTARSHLGKTTFRPLMRVSFQSGNSHDTVAWALPDVEAWLNALAQ